MLAMINNVPLKNTNPPLIVKAKESSDCIVSFAETIIPTNMRRKPAKSNTFPN